MSGDNNKSEPAKLSLTTTVFILCLLGSAVLGGLVSGYHQQIYAAAAPLFGIRTVTDSVDDSLLQKTYHLLEKNYDGNLDKQELAVGAAKGMVDAAGDDYTKFFDEKEAAKFDDDLTGSIGGGIGAQIGLTDDVITLVKILPSTPAERAGLKASDKILAINDEPTKGYSVEDAVDKIRGEVGTTVKLDVLRDGKKQVFNITRDEINAPSVYNEVKDGIGILTIVRFDNSTERQAKKAVQKFEEQKVKGVVLDLRGNPGGYLDAAKGVAGIWLDDKLVVTEKEAGKVVDSLYSGSGSMLSDMPTVVLIDGNSASASEIVAGALKDHHAATLIGETTFGKGSVQRMIPLSGGAMLKVTVARWYTPNDKNISKEGVTPDRTVKLDEKKFIKGEDSQLEAAIKYLR